MPAAAGREDDGARVVCASTVRGELGSPRRVRGVDVPFLGRGGGRWCLADRRRADPFRGARGGGSARGPQRRLSAILLARENTSRCRSSSRTDLGAAAAGGGAAAAFADAGQWPCLFTPTAAPRGAVQSGSRSFPGHAARRRVGLEMVAWFNEALFDVAARADRGSRGDGLRLPPARPRRGPAERGRRPQGDGAGLAEAGRQRRFVIDVGPGVVILDFAGREEPGEPAEPDL